jgi:HD-GYP domain-containing protein (c-di-GMP phosphodiesterase class II)
LTTEERMDLARHPVIGEREASRVGADRAAQLLVRWHHEWWNGAGYPDALRREEIPLAARILRVADSYAALTDARPFRTAFTEAEARRELADRAGLEFDPAVVNVLLSLEPLPEMASFAKIGEDEPEFEGEVKKDRGWNLFSSFSK